MNKNFFNSYISKKHKKDALNLISSSNLNEGSLHKKFEYEIGKKINNHNVTIVNSGSIALYVSLLSLNLNNQDEIIMTNRSWISTLHAAILLNYKIKLVDVNLYDENIDTDLIEKAITKKTKVLLVVNRNGKISNRKKINILKKKYNLLLIEDCAQSFLSGDKEDYVNPEADFSCFSFGPTKLLNTGQGGAIISKNKKLDIQIKHIKYNGIYSKKKLSWGNIGFNFKFTDLQSAFGIIQLKHIEEKKKKLRKIYELFTKKLNENLKINILTVQKNEIPLYLEILCSNRSQLIRYLNKNGIGVDPFYGSLSDSPLSSKFRLISKNNNSKIFKNYGLWLPSGSSQNLSQISKMCDLINYFYLKN